MFILRTAFITFILLLLVIVGALSVGHQQSDDLLLSDVYPCEGRICVLGIAYDVTPLAYATALFESDLRFKFADNSLYTVYKLSPPFYRVDLYYGGSKLVTDVELVFSSGSQVTAASMIAKFGAPCAVELPRLSLIYPNMKVYFELASTEYSARLATSLPIETISLVDNDIAVCSQMKFNEDRLPWRGFGVYLRPPEYSP